MSFPDGSQFFSFFHEECLGKTWCKTAALDVLIKADDVDVRVCQERALRLDVEGCNTGAAEGLYPAFKLLRAREPADFADKFGLDALTLEWRNERWRVHSLSSSAFARRRRHRISNK